VEPDLTNWWLSIYAPLTVAGLLVSISYWRWAFIMSDMAHDAVMRDLIIGIALGFTALVIENLLYAYARLTISLPIISPAAFFVTKLMYIVAAVLHLHAMFRQMTGSNRSTLRVVGICSVAWVAAFFLIVVT